MLLNCIQGEQIYRVTCRSVGDLVVIYRDTPGDIRVCEFQINNYRKFEFQINNYRKFEFQIDNHRKFGQYWAIVPCVHFQVFHHKDYSF